MSSPEPIHDLARGDVAVSRQLSSALRVIRDRSADPQLKKQIGDILAGRGSARELMHSTAFHAVLDRTLPAAMQRFTQMPEDERERLAEQGRAQLDQFREQPPEWPVPAEEAPAPPPPEPPPSPAAAAPPVRRKSYRDQVVTPDEPDEDDLYYRDRRENGWLR
ncbi:hypothetical protein [Nocardia sp. NPDC024068]|uniref:hypothetical protein n=1 Tax=Nocardia sp. NPDC024068 TaxID=3157197 RepID=UPI0033F1412D